MRVLKRVSIEDINLNDHRFVFSYPLSYQRLYNSIKEIGLISPVLLRGEGSPYQVIDGLQRILACQKARVPSIEALIYPEDSLDELGGFHLAIHLNIHNRSLNPIEKAIILYKLLNQFQIDPEKIIQHYMPLLELPPARKVFKNFLLLNSMEEELKLAIAKGEFAVELDWEISKFSPSERQVLFRLGRDLKLGINKMREIIRYLEEISLRDGTPLVSLLTAEEVQRVLAQERMTIPQKGEKLRQIVKEKRYPQLSKLEKTFSEGLKKLRLPPDLKLTPPPFFEGDKLTLKAQFNSPEALKDLALTLLEAAEKETLQRLLEDLL